MLIAFRIFFTASFFYVLREATRDAALHPDGDLANAGYMALACLVGILMSATWAPFFGRALAGTVTESMTGGNYLEHRKLLLTLARWLDFRGRRRLASWTCFFEGINRPSMPTGFIIGLKNAAPGSWLEKVFAREVFRFDNAVNCMNALEALRRHGIDPGRHPRTDVQLLLSNMDLQPAADRPRLVIPPPPPRPPLKRNRRIQLFGE